MASSKILIISSEDDACTSLVLDWFFYYDIEFVRISGKDFLEIHHLDLQNFDNTEFSISGDLFKISDFKAVWYRRSSVNLLPQEKVGFSDHVLSNTVNHQLEQEYGVLRSYFLQELKKKSINSQIDNNLNKLSVLKRAEELGLKVPRSIITCKKNKLSNFNSTYKNIVSKNFTPGFSIKSEEFRFGAGTILVDEQITADLPDRFYPILFQEMIKKAFELRIFFLTGSFYASAIFSQNDEKTKVDFRNYNFEKPNRTPPFDLPIEVKTKLHELMRSLELNSGSIDMIVDEDGEFVFLEINPVGQFFQVSYPCNYYLEKAVSEQFL